MQINYDKFVVSFSAIFKPPVKSTKDTLKALVSEFNKHMDAPLEYRKEKLAYMFATVMHECGTKMEPIVENMNYSAQRLMVVWPTRFKTLTQAKQYEYQPEKLGNYVYANRLGNCDASSGDGYRYRGRGIGAQFTGRENYEKFGRMFGIDLVDNPELACDLDIGAKILYKGCLEGLFTGRKLSDFLNARYIDYKNARRVVNCDVGLNGNKLAQLCHNFEIVLDNSLES